MKFTFGYGMKSPPFFIEVRGSNFRHLAISISSMRAEVLLPMTRMVAELVAELAPELAYGYGRVAMHVALTDDTNDIILGLTTASTGNSTA